MRLATPGVRLMAVACAFGFGAVLSLVAPASAGAQVAGGSTCAASVADSAQSIDQPWSFGAWFAGGTHEPIKTREGHREDRALYLVGVQAALNMARGRFVELNYTPAVVPAIIATANREYTPVVLADGSMGLLISKKTAFGAGLLPIAFEARLFKSDRAGLVIGTAGGAAYFDRRIPDPAETRFNFLANGHAGLYLRSAIGTTTVGFWLQHISNGNTGQVNPGLDSRMLYVAFGLP